MGNLSFLDRRFFSGASRFLNRYASVQQTGSRLHHSGNARAFRFRKRAHFLCFQF